MQVPDSNFIEMVKDLNAMMGHNKLEQLKQPEIWEHLSTDQKILLINIESLGKTRELISEYIEKYNVQEPNTKPEYQG